jgi:Trypsin-like peptidase domain
MDEMSQFEAAWEETISEANSWEIDVLDGGASFHFDGDTVESLDVASQSLGLRNTEERVLDLESVVYDSQSVLVEANSFETFGEMFAKIHAAGPLEAAGDRFDSASEANDSDSAVFEETSLRFDELSVVESWETAADGFLLTPQEGDAVAPQKGLVHSIISVPAKDENSSEVNLWNSPSEVNESMALAVALDSTHPIGGGIGQHATSDQIRDYGLVRSIITAPATNENSSEVNLWNSSSELNESVALAMDWDCSRSIVGGIGHHATSDQIQDYDEMAVTSTYYHMTQKAPLRIDDVYVYTLHISDEHMERRNLSEDLDNEAEIPEVAAFEDGNLLPSEELQEDVANHLNNATDDEASSSSDRETVESPSKQDAVEMHRKCATPVNLSRPLKETMVDNVQLQFRDIGSIASRANDASNLVHEFCLTSRLPSFSGFFDSTIANVESSNTQHEENKNEDDCVLKRCPSCERDRSVVRFPPFPRTNTVQLALLDYSKRKMVSLGTGFVFSAERGLIGTCTHLIFDMITRQPKVRRPPLYVLVGVCDNDGVAAAVFRFIAVVERDEDNFRTDVCFVKIRSRLEFDVRTEEEACNIQMSSASSVTSEDLRQLHSLPLSTGSVLGDHVQFGGFQQGTRSSLIANNNVCRSIDLIRGFVACESTTSDSTSRRSFIVVIGWQSISGHSGSPVYDVDNRIIGIVQGFDADHPHRNYVIPVSRFVQMIRRSCDHNQIPIPGIFE